MRRSALPLPWVLAQTSRTSGANKVWVSGPEGKSGVYIGAEHTASIQKVPKMSRRVRLEIETTRRGCLQSIAHKQVLYLTTIGRRTGLPRQIEIWFVVCGERFYLFAETGEAAGWVKNIRRNHKVTVRVGEWQLDAMARVLDRQADRKLWDNVAMMANHKYGWGEGLPVEVTPLGTPGIDQATVKTSP